MTRKKCKARRVSEERKMKVRRTHDKSAGGRVVVMMMMG